MNHRCQFIAFLWTTYLAPTIDSIRLRSLFLRLLTRELMGKQFIASEG